MELASALLVKSAEDAMMQHLVLTIVTVLVGKPVDVKCDLASDGTILCRVTPPAGDTGKVIGKHGRTARAIRTIMAAGSARTGQRYQLDIIGENEFKKEQGD